jgi:hypothetical protein
VTFNGTADQTITSNGNSFNHLVLNNTGTSESDDILLTDRLSVGGNLSDSATGHNSTFTVGGNLSLDANNNATESIDFNNATLEMTGDGTQLSYTNLASFWANGFKNLTVGAAGTSTQLNNHLTVKNVLTVGSGALTGSSMLCLSGSPDPLSFDAAANVSVGTLAFLAWGGPPQILPCLPNGYDCNISVSADGLALSQTGNVTINAPNSLLIKGDNVASRAVTFNTEGYDLTVGGNLILGNSDDNATKTFSATNSTVIVGGDFTINHSSNVFNSSGSTVTLNGTTDQTVTSNGKSFNDLTINNTGADGDDDIIHRRWA